MLSCTPWNSSHYYRHIMIIGFSFTSQPFSLPMVLVQNNLRVYPSKDFYSTVQALFFLLNYNLAFLFSSVTSCLHLFVNPFTFKKASLDFRLWHLLKSGFELAGCCEEAFFSSSQREKKKKICQLSNCVSENGAKCVKTTITFVKRHELKLEVDTPITKRVLHFISAAAVYIGKVTACVSLSKQLQTQLYAVMGSTTIP